MRGIGLLLLTIALPIPLVVVATADDDRIAVAKRLYEAASYEDALNLLANTNVTVDADLANKYQALCLLALGRRAEAEQIIERLMLRRPEQTFSATDTPPGLIALHRAVRKRMLPGIVTTRYQAARATFDRGAFIDAAAKFNDLVALLSDKQLNTEMGISPDLQVLIDGFSRLAQQRATTAGLVPGADTRQTEMAPSTQTATAPPSVVSAPPRAEEQITPPVAINQRLPPWNPPEGYKFRASRGAIQIVIDENGAVASAIIQRPINALYDRELLDATKKWKFVPAKKDGQPVAFEKTIEVTLENR
jgi:TonB family protein